MMPNPTPSPTSEELAAMAARRMQDEEVCDMCAAGHYNRPPKQHGYDCSRRYPRKKPALAALAAVRAGREKA